MKKVQLSAIFMNGYPMVVVWDSTKMKAKDTPYKETIRYKSCKDKIN